MSRIPQGDNTTQSKSVRVTQQTWRSVSHEAVELQSSITKLLSVAWEQFVALPQNKREKLVREAEAQFAETTKVA